MEGIQGSWPGLRDRWRQTLGEKFQQIAEEALSRWHEQNPRIKDSSIALQKDLDKAVSEDDKFNDYRNWHARHKDLAVSLFGKDYEPYFEKFLAATIKAVPASRLPQHRMLTGKSYFTAACKIRSTGSFGSSFASLAILMRIPTAPVSASSRR